VRIRLRKANPDDSDSDLFVVGFTRSSVQIRPPAGFLNLGSRCLPGVPFLTGFPSQGELYHRAILTFQKRRADVLEHWNRLVET
jgi:hypothetical protein